MARVWPTLFGNYMPMKALRATLAESERTETGSAAFRTRSDRAVAAGYSRENDHVRVRMTLPCRVRSSSR